MANRVVICMLIHRINLRSRSVLNPATKRSMRSMVSVVCLAKSSRVARVGMMASSFANLVSMECYLSGVIHVEF